MLFPTNPPSLLSLTASYSPEEFGPAIPLPWSVHLFSVRGRAEDEDWVSSFLQTYLGLRTRLHGVQENNLAPWGSQVPQKSLLTVLFLPRLNPTLFTV